jgi:hypothetical protein
MFSFINGRALNARLLNWSLIKQFLVKKKLSMSVELIDATLHGKDGAAERLLEQTYQLLTNKKSSNKKEKKRNNFSSYRMCSCLFMVFRPFVDSAHVHDDEFTDHSYQQNLAYHQQAHASKSIKNNLKTSELLTDPCYAYQAQRVR